MDGLHNSEKIKEYFTTQGLHIKDPSSTTNFINKDSKINIEDKFDDDFVDISDVDFG